MQGEQPDRVPVMCQLSIGHMLLQTGFRPHEFWLSAELFATGLVRLRELYSFDGILVSLHGHRPDWDREIIAVRQEGEKEIVIWRNGDRTIFPPDDLPLHLPTRPIVPPDFTSFALESIPEEIDYIPVSQGLMFPIDREHGYDIFDLVKSQAGEEYSIHGEVTSPFDYYLHLFGFEQAMLFLIRDPVKVKAVLQCFTTGIIRIARRQLEKGVDAIKISSPFAGAGFISPRFYREFVLPFERQIALAVREEGVPVYLHTCGAIGDRLELMIETGVSGLECLDPPPLGNVTLEEAKRRIGHRVFIKGNIDPVNVLLKGDRETIQRDVLTRLAIGKKGNRYILSTACSVAPRTPRSNVQLLAELVEEAGWY
jgi:hypothetical protein